MKHLTCSKTLSLHEKYHNEDMLKFRLISNQYVNFSGIYDGLSTWNYRHIYRLHEKAKTNIKIISQVQGV